MKLGLRASICRVACRVIASKNNQPDMDLANGINLLGENCRKCRVFPTVERARETEAARFFRRNWSAGERRCSF